MHAVVLSTHDTSAAATFTLGAGLSLLPCVTTGLVLRVHIARHSLLFFLVAVAAERKGLQQSLNKKLHSQRPTSLC